MDLLSVCRLCLSEKLEMYDIFSEAADSYTFRDAVQDISQIRIEADDQLSKNICLPCKEACTQFISFRDTIVSSNDYQLKIFNAEQAEQLETCVVEELADEEVPETKEELSFGDDDEEYEYLEEFENDRQADASNDFVTIASSDESTDEGGQKCPKCSKTFSDQAKFDEHVKSHLSKVRTFPCRTCKRKFTTENMRTCHEIVHSDLITEIRKEAGNRCLICNELSATKADLEDHIRDHKASLEKGPISCIYCPKQFTKLNNLTRHLKTHEENKTHKCNQCSKTFAMGQELIDHLGRHKGAGDLLSKYFFAKLDFAGIRQHVCNFCDETFQQASRLKHHLEESHGLPSCGKGHVSIKSSIVDLLTEF